MAKAVHITSTEQFETYIRDTPNVVVDFHAVWCGPCHMIAPVYEKLAGAHAAAGKIAFLKVDVDEQAEIAQKYGITAMPTFLVPKDGEVAKSIRGANPPALNAAVQEIVAAVAAEAPKAVAGGEEARKEESVGQ